MLIKKYMFKLNKNMMVAKIDKNIWKRFLFSLEGTWIQS